MNPGSSNSNSGPSPSKSCAGPPLSASSGAVPKQPKQLRQKPSLQQQQLTLQPLQAHSVVYQPHASQMHQPRIPLSPSGGAVPKSPKQLRQKPSLHHQPFQDHSVVSQPHASQMHQHSSLHGYFPNSGGSQNSEELMQSASCKNIPKNQLLFEWHGGECTSDPPKTCRNQLTPSDNYDSASDDGSSLDNSHILTTNSFRGIFSEVNSPLDQQFHRFRMNGHESGSAAPPSVSPSEGSISSRTLNNGSSSDHPVRNVESNHHPTANVDKKINLSSTPDRTQVEYRLSQIQDYIKQTTSLMEAYKQSDVSNTEAAGLDLASCLPNAHEVHLNGIDLPSKPDTRKQMEIKLKFEESLKQLQTEQALLMQRRNEAQEQLQETQRARNTSISFTGNGHPVNCQSDSASLLDTLMNNLQDVEKRLSNVMGKNMNARIEGLQASPSRDQSGKRRTTDATQADVTTYLKELLTGDEIKEQASSEDSAVEDAIDEYEEARNQVRLQGKIVEEKRAEISALRAQLDQAKSLLNLAQRRDTHSNSVDVNASDDAVAEQAVNIQRQRGEEDMQLFMQSESRRTEPSQKQQLLDEERAKLRRLQALLTTVQEYRSSDRPIPEHILQEFGSEVQSCCTSPAHASGSLKERRNEDAAVEADIEEDDEPESTTIWNQPHLSLLESASMASELSQGLQQRAAQLQVERDGLAAMQRQLDGLFNQLRLHQSSERSVDSSNAAAPNTMVNADGESPSLLGLNNSQEVKRASEVTQRRAEILSDLHSRWQQLQEEVAQDGELCVKAGPVLTAGRMALNTLSSHILSRSDATATTAEEMIWDQRSLPSRGHLTPTRSEHTPRAASGERELFDRSQMSSAPSTLMRSRPSAKAHGMWSSVNSGDGPGLSNNTPDALRYGTMQSEDNPPIVSVPSPSPSILHQQNQEMKNRFAALSHSCQSLCMDNVNGSAALPLMPAIAIPPPALPASASSSHDREAYYQQLLAAGQLQQQQVLLTAINQCFHILKLQQHEIIDLRNSLHLQSSVTSHLSQGAALSGAHPGIHQGMHTAVHPIVHPPVNSSVHQVVHSGLLQNEEQWQNQSPASCPGPPTLNNQVPPGNRTNNYWDNFRSYSRQNLLSTSAKSNEGLPHSPSPLVERSHNSLRTSTPMSMPGPSSISVGSALPAMRLPQFHHSLSTQHCLHGSIAGLSESSGLADCTGVTIGAVGPVPHPSTEFSHSSPLMPNISRKDKRNIDHAEGGLVSPRRRPSNEIDHRTASRVLENAALPLNSQMPSPAAHEFDIPPMPILRNSAASLRLNQVNLNSQPLSSLQDLMESQNQSTRQQLNNEGVPFSEISSSLTNQQFNEFAAAGSLDNTRDGKWRLNMGYSSGMVENDPSPVLKRNTGAIKRTYPSSQISATAPAFTPNYQRNIQSSSVIPHVSSSNSSCNSETSKTTSRLSGGFAVSSSESESVVKSSKQPSGQDSIRNFNCIRQRAGCQEDIQIPCSPSSECVRKMEHKDSGEPRLSYNEESEHDDFSLLRNVTFNNCQSSASSQSSSSQNTSNFELRSFGPEKNKMKDACMQMRKGLKHQSKSGSRSPLFDNPQAIASPTQSVPQSNIQRQTTSKSRPGSSSQQASNKTNQDYSITNHMSAQGQLFEEQRESMNAEMTSLISADLGRSHFLVQLLRDVQHTSSDSVRQSVLQLIQQAVGRSQIDLNNVVANGYTSTEKDEAEDDEDEVKRLEMQRLAYAGVCSSSDFKFWQGNISSTQEGETLMQLVLGLELAAVLSANADENVSATLFEDIKRRVFQLVPFVPLPQSPSSNRSYLHLSSQIENVLESVFLKFKGCRVGDVRSEMTTTVVSSLPIKLMYCSMVDYYSHNKKEVEGQTIRESSSPLRDGIVSPSTSTNGATSNSLHYPHVPHLDGRDLGFISEASNGDLAEADQSHHILNSVDSDGDVGRDCSSERLVSATVPDSASSLLHAHVFQLGSAAEAIDPAPEVGTLQESSGSSEDSECRIDVLGAVGGAGMAKISEDNVAEQWTLEQELICDQNGEDTKDLEREQGLDQVPTRLACDSDRDQDNGEKHSSSSHLLSFSSNGTSSSP